MKHKSDYTFLPARDLFIEAMKAQHFLPCGMRGVSEQLGLNDNIIIMGKLTKEVPENLRNEQTERNASPLVAVSEHRRTAFTDERPIRRLCVSVQEAAAMLGVSPVSIYRALHRGILKSSNAFRHRLIPLAELERFIKATTQVILLFSLVAAVVGGPKLENARLQVSVSSVTQGCLGALKQTVVII